jgi:anti-anti-sigma factor
MIIGGVGNNISVNVTESTQHKGITIITVKGILDTVTAPEFEQQFRSVLDNKKFKLVIDLTDVEYISSAGWGNFISEIKRIRGEKGDLVLAGMKPAVTDIYELLEFDTFLKSFPDVESAVSKGFKKS